MLTPEEMERLKVIKTTLTRLLVSQRNFMVAIQLLWKHRKEQLNLPENLIEDIFTNFVETNYQIAELFHIDDLPSMQEIYDSSADIVIAEDFAISDEELEKMFFSTDINDIVQ